MKGNKYIFYTPENQYPGMPHGEMCGDIMPYYREGRFILFFLYKYCIYAVETKDFVHYGNCRLVLQNGSPDEQDWHAATGSVCHHNGLFWFYYTGFCEGNRGEEGKHEQGILRAVSRDLYVWEKDKEFFFYPDGRYFKDLHWRDPHVFWNEELKKFCMLVTAEEKDGACLRGGCSAVYVSEDIENWSYYKTIYKPGIFPTHECQDAFQMGGRWYLTFSTYSRHWETRYRMAERFEGDWETPSVDDMFDGREFYAAKTVTDGRDRYLVGWQSIRRDCRDDGKFVWGGNVVVHRLVQREDKTLGVAMPDTIRNAFDLSVPLQIIPMRGEWKEAEELSCESRRGFAWAQIGRLSGTMLFEGTAEWDVGTQALGLMIHTDGRELKTWCQLRLEPAHNRIVMERYDQIDGDQFYPDERRLRFSENRAEVKLLVSNNIMQVYVNDTALTVRCYSVKDGGLGLFAECGAVKWRGMRLLAGKETENV